MLQQINNFYNRFTRRLKTEAGAIAIKMFPAACYKRMIVRGIHNFKNKENDAKQIKRTIPFIAIEGSNLCNLDCLMCRTHESKREKKEMALGLFEKVASQQIRFKQRLLVMHTVGEPLLCSYLEEVFKICSRYKIFLNLTTNGILIPNKIDLIRKYRGVIRYMAFSVDGATKETYEKIRRGARFEALIESLELIKEYNKRPGRKIHTHLQACISKDNFNEIPLFFKTFAKYFSPEQILFGFITNLSGMPNGSEYYRNSLPLKTDFYKLFPCKLLWNQISVLNDGRISACCRDYNGDLIMGDINKTDILDIWRSSAYEDLRQKHLSGRIEEVPLCNRCYRVERSFLDLFNWYARYLFAAYGERTNEYYLDRLNMFLSFFDKRFCGDRVI